MLHIKVIIQETWKSPQKESIKTPNPSPNTNTAEHVKEILDSTSGEKIAENCVNCILDWGNAYVHTAPKRKTAMSSG